MTLNSSRSDLIDHAGGADEPAADRAAARGPGLPLLLWLNALGLLAVVLPAVAASRFAGERDPEGAGDPAREGDDALLAAADDIGDRALDGSGKLDGDRRADDAGALDAPDETDEAADAEGDVEGAADDAIAAEVGAAIAPVPVGAAGRKVRPRKVERALKQQQAAQDVLEDADDQHPALGPVVRHLNNVIRDLQDAHQTIGTLTAQRDALRQQLVELTGKPVLDDDEETFRSNKDARLAARAEAESGEAGEIGRLVLRRRLIAVGAVALLGAGVYIASANGADLSNFSRESLAQIAFIGPLMQVFLIGWLLYRVVRVGGKGARWLFPEPEKQRRRRR